MLGAEYEPWAYDNELEAHEMELPLSVSTARPSRTRVHRVRRQPRVSRAQALERRRAGEWREREDANAPLYWERTS